MIVGIDPGTKTGLAVWNGKALSVVQTTTITAALEYVLELSRSDTVQVYVEDCRKRRWFGNAGRERLKGVGSVNRDCAIWEEFCNRHGIRCHMEHPKNGKTKLSSEQFRKITGWEGRTSEHGRDAAMMVFGR